MRQVTKMRALFKKYCDESIINHANKQYVNLGNFRISDLMTMFENARKN